MNLNNQFISIREDKNILYISLNRPRKRNAFQPDMIKELTRVFKDAGGKLSLRAIVLNGEGKSFCSGADLEWMQSMVNYSFEENQKDSEKLFEMFEVIKNCPLPVIGRVHGHVMGGALGLLSVCDVVAAEEETKFGFTEVRIGLTPAVISPFVLRKLKPEFKFLLLTGEIFSASVAMFCGMVQFIGPQADVDQFVENFLITLESTKPEAVRETKKLMLALDERNLSEAKAITTKVISERRVSDEGQKGLRSFLESKN